MERIKGCWSELRTRGRTVDAAAERLGYLADGGGEGGAGRRGRRLPEIEPHLNLVDFFPVR